MTDHATPGRIYLQPTADDPDTGRLWCEDDDPANLGEPWTPYVSVEYVRRVIDEMRLGWDEADDWPLDSEVSFRDRAYAQGFRAACDAIREALEADDD